MTLFPRLRISPNACGSCVSLVALWKHDSFAANITGLQIGKYQCFSLHCNDRNHTSFSNLMERLSFTSTCHLTIVDVDHCSFHSVQFHGNQLTNLIFMLFEFVWRHKMSFKELPPFLESGTALISFKLIQLYMIIYLIMRL